jgi:hypothetical protein
VAFADDVDAGWIRARAELVPGCEVQRTVVVCDDYLIDHIEWDAAEQHELTLPLHGVRAIDADGSPVASTPARIEGGGERADGFSFLSETARLHLDGATVAHLIGVRDTCRSLDFARDDRTGYPERAKRVAGSAPTLRGWLFTTPHAAYQSATAPGAPSRPSEPMVLVRARANNGSILAVWSWRGGVQSANYRDAIVTVQLTSGRVDTHRALDQGWSITRSIGANDSTTELAGVVSRASETTPQSEPAPTPDLPAHSLPLRITLGAAHYRRSEESWDEAGRPEATIEVARDGADLVVTIEVPRSERNFVDIGAENPYDNEPAAINGDGVQLYVTSAAARGAWLLVPNTGSDSVGAREIEGWDGGLAVRAAWRQSGEGYALTARVAMPDSASEASLDVLVNETPRWRVRRRGQLILSGSHEEFVYLRGDRHEADRLLHVAFDQG